MSATSAIIADRGKPGTIVLDNGTELTSMAILKWCRESNIDWRYSMKAD